VSKIDLSAIKAGDFVTVMCRAEAVDWKNDPDAIDFHLGLKAHGLGVIPLHILSHEPAPPKPIEVGETVFVDGYGEAPFNVKAIDDGIAWLKQGFDLRIHRPLSDLTRVED